MTARRGELVGDGAEVRHTERVADHPEDVGVLEEQRPPPRAVERMGEGEDLLSVAIGHRSGGADRDVAGGDRRRHRGAGSQLLRGVAALRSWRRGEHDPAGAPGGARQQPAGAAGQPADGERPEEWTGRARQARGTARALRGRRRSRGEDLLDRRGEHHVVAVLADSLRDGARVAAVAHDRRAREPGADPGVVDREAGHPDQDAGAANRRVVGDHVDHLDVEARDLGASHHREARAPHPRSHLRQGHDRVGGACRPRRRRAHGHGQKQGAAEQVLVSVACAADTFERQAIGEGAPFAEHTR
jgi:hypothetical protein